MQGRGWSAAAVQTVEGTAICRFYPLGQDPAALGDGGFSQLLLARGRWTRCAVWVKLPASWNNAVLTLWAESDGLRGAVAQTVVDGANFRQDSAGNWFGLAFEAGPISCDSWTVTGQISAAMVPGDRTGGTLSAQLWNEWGNP